MTKRGRETAYPYPLQPTPNPSLKGREQKGRNKKNKTPDRKSPLEGEI